MKVNYFGWTGLLVLAMASSSGSRLVLNSLIPKGGETISARTPLKISWTVTTTHKNGTEIAFSKDGGTSWTTIEKGIVDQVGVNTFVWPGPDASTNIGKIRICQPDVTVCTDANRVSAPTSGAPYVLVSGNFRVTDIATKVDDVTGESNALSLIVQPDYRSVEVSFTNRQIEAVLLQAFDTQGRLVATLIEGTYSAGSHQLSVFSNRLQRSARALVFKLKVGNQVKTQTWNGM